MNESILLTIKRLLTPGDTSDYFDPELIVPVNAALNKLYDIGIGPPGFQITGVSETWSSLTTDMTKLGFVKSFVHINTKLLFDPPQSSAVMEQLRSESDEYEWRIAKDT